MGLAGQRLRVCWVPRLGQWCLAGWRTDFDVVKRKMGINCGVRPSGLDCSAVKTAGEQGQSFIRNFEGERVMGSISLE